MTKAEFISELESLLQDISEEERLEAVQFYQNYFEDAGKENEQNVLSELGSPSKVARTIKADLNSNQQEAGNRGYFTENGYEDGVFTEAKYEIIQGNVKEDETEKITSEGSNIELNRQTDYDDNKVEYTYKNNAEYENAGGYPKDSSYNNGSNYNSNSSYNNSSSNKYYNTYDKDNKSSASKVLLVILCIFALPVGISLIASVFSVLISVAATIFLLWLSFALISVTLLISGIIVVFAGIIKFITLPAVGLCLAGGGLIVLGIGLLFTMAAIGISSKLFPAIPHLFRSFINLCRLPFQNRRVAA